MSELQAFLKQLHLKKDQYHTILDYLSINWHTPCFQPTLEQYKKITEIVTQHGTGYTLAKWIKTQNSLRKYGVTSPNKLENKRKKASITLKEKTKKGIRFGGNIPGVNALSKEIKLQREKELETQLKVKWGDNYKDLTTGEKIAITCKKNCSHEHQFIKNKEKVLKQYPGFVYFNDFSSNHYFAYYLQKLGKLSQIKTTFIGTLVLKEEIEQLNLNQLYNQYIQNKPLKGKSQYEEAIANFIKSLHYDVYRNTRKILNGKELDIFVPEKNIAIEFNGLYWHSDEFLDKKYHLQKTNLCKEKGIQLIQFFGDEWIEKEPICKSIISSRLGKANTLYARQCTVSKIDKKVGKDFVDNNHLQGSVPGGEYWGLLHENELVQVIQIGASRFKKQEIELLRMCSKLNTRVIGGFSKLLKHQPYNKIYTFVDIRLYTGAGYEKTGWKTMYTTPPSYFYTKGGKRENRIKYQKHKLKSILKIYDEYKSEKENMYINGYHRIYDCGTIKMMWQR